MASQAEIESLRRQVRALSSELAKANREHSRELGAKDTIILKKAKNEKVIAGLKSERAHLRVSLEMATRKLQANAHQIASLQQELQVFTVQVDAARKRINDLEEALTHNPGSALRLKVKSLAVKYHPDHQGLKTVGNDEVTRDLVDLLAI